MQKQAVFHLISKHLLKNFCGLLMSLRNKEKQREKPQKASLSV